MNKPPYNKEQLDVAIHAMDGTPFEEGRGFKEYQEELCLPDISFFRNKKILDLGAGPALRFARDLENAHINAEVHSLSAAFSKESWRAGALAYTQGDAVSRYMVAAMAEAMPYQDGYFDIIVSHSALDWSETTKQYITQLKEVCRVLARGGEAFIYSISTDPQDTQGAIYILPEQLNALLGSNITVSYIPPVEESTSSEPNDLIVLHLKKK